jgi:hypothetical protein
MKEQVICRFAKFTPNAVQYQQVDPSGKPIKRDGEGLVVGNINLRKTALKGRKTPATIRVTVEY